MEAEIPNGCWRVPARASVCNHLSALLAFTARGYWANPFPDGDGITLDLKESQSAERVVQDIEGCFEWEVRRGFSYVTPASNSSAISEPIDMNGGQVATRGFLLQTLIALLDMLADVHEIESLRLEPATDEDKTDFVVEYVGGRKKAVQVKSSINQIGLPAAKKWVRSLKADLPANEHELCLIGPVSGDLAKTTEWDGVAIPTPKSLDVKGMLEQASHRLDIYLHERGMTTGSPLLRQLIVDGLIGKLSAYSTSGTALTRAELEKVFREWVEGAEQIASDNLRSRYGDGTLTDVDALKEYAAQFDRAALQDSLRGCWSYKRFGESLGELIELVNTGKAKGQFVTKRRADFGNPKWRAGLDDVYHEVRSLREVYSKLVKSGHIDEATCGD